MKMKTSVSVRDLFGFKTMYPIMPTVTSVDGVARSKFPLAVDALVVGFEVVFARVVPMTGGMVAGSQGFVVGDGCAISK